METVFDLLNTGRRRRSSVIAPALLPANRWLSPEEVAALINVKPGTLANQRSRRVGIPFHKLGWKVRYAREDVARWIAANRVQTRG